MSTCQSDLDVAVAGLPYFAALRPDEIVRAGTAFSVRELGAGEVLEISADDPVELILMVRGRVDLTLPGEHRQLYAGDRYGDLSADTHELRPARLLAVKRPATVAILDRAGLDSLLHQFPVAAMPLCEEIAADLKWKNDLLRELEIIHAEGLADAPRQAALASRKRKLRSRRRGIIRVASSAIWRRLVVERDKDPAFWVLTGFLVALATARTVVRTILTFNLQKKLFALIPAANGLNPIHVHHFNYGIALVVLCGILALLPTGRRLLRPLGFAFGVGLGLIVDEFALLWHLDPDYYQRSSYVAMIVAALVLTQVIYFRELYPALLRRAMERVRAWRS